MSWVITAPVANETDLFIARFDTGSAHCALARRFSLTGGLVKNDGGRGGSIQRFDAAWYQSAGGLRLDAEFADQRVRG